MFVTDRLKELNDELRDIHQVQNEWAGLENDAHRLAQFSTVGGWWYRLCMFFARKGREGREECAAIRREIEAEINEERRANK